MSANTDGFGKIYFVEIKGKGQTIYGVLYYIVDDSERQRIQSFIKEHQQPLKP
ncbi:hypothetical protein [Paenibacillus sp. R14(2021)]|uniref:hypothetical protein n=1 Tax=Paenibacillus sp. R14(2021) TaxID=2859228 RepID=UPI001C615686|nr:hypothetical protein [Paenibacillus sp. R14(2021)]